MAQWKFVLAKSNDLSSLGELTQARQKSLTLTLNRPGSATFTIPMDADLADDISVVSRAVKCYRRGSDDVSTLIWSGYISTIDENIKENTMTVNCIGWLDRLDKRFLRQDKIWSTTDDADIIFDLLEEANLTTAPDSYSVPVVAGSSPNNPTWIQEGSKLPNEGTGGATAYVATTRNKKLDKLTVIGPEILALTELENGCDIYVTPDTRTLNIYRKKMKNRTGAIFGYNWGPNNLSEFGRQIDSTTLVNYMLTTGRPASTPQFAHDTTSQSTYGLIEEVVNLADAKDNSILLAYAGEEVILRSTPRIIYSVQPFPFASGVPEPFIDYEPGDKVYLTAKWGARINIQNQALRVFGMQLNVDEEGNERLGPLQLAPG